MWLLFGLFANLPTASSIQCYQCADYPGSPDPCEGSSAIQCESLFDSCIAVGTEVEFAGMHFNQTFKNCSIAASPSCNQTCTCDLIDKSVAEAGGEMLLCGVTCCQTDRCNGPDEGWCLLLLLKICTELFILKIIKSLYSGTFIQGMLSGRARGLICLLKRGRNGEVSN